MAQSPQTTITDDLYQPQRPNSFVPQKAMLWYDAIVDDMLANPGTTIKATAARLGRSPVTIGYIVNSDLFRARYAQRRDQFNEALDTRLIGKLAKVAELSLDLTLESLEKKRTTVPLPLLHEVSDKALARLGYGPKQNGTPATTVVVNNSSSGSVSIPSTVSPEALQNARDMLRTIEGRATEPSLRESAYRDLSRSDPSRSEPPFPVAPPVAADEEEKSAALDSL
jgi:hypothetical protein